MLYDIRAKKIEEFRSFDDFLLTAHILNTFIPSPLYYIHPLFTIANYIRVPERRTYTASPTSIINGSEREVVRGRASA